MHKPEFITFTGIDNWTDIDALRDLGRKYPIEWGILFSRSRQGVDPRYPTVTKMSDFLWADLCLSAHLCGDYAREIMDEGRITGNVPADLGLFKRIQINHAEPAPEMIIQFRNGWGKMRCIAQTRGDAFPADTSVDWLFDCAGGRGVSPAGWPPHSGKGRLLGYAGGISTGNVADVVSRLAQTPGRYWIDMESGIRTNDRFDVAKCRAVCESVYGAA